MLVQKFLYCYSSGVLSYALTLLRRSIKNVAEGLTQVDLMDSNNIV